MPAPSPSGIMFGRNISSHGIQHELRDFQRASSDYNGNRISPGISISPPTTNQRMYDEMFTSTPVTEVKTMLWEIRDFNTVFENRVERAMNFEFEVGRLGSMERHIPRRSRWKLLFDVGDSCSRIPALRVVQLSPENKIIFYKLQACIMQGSDTHPGRETELKIAESGFKEGTSDQNSNENLFPFQFLSTETDHFGDEIGGSEFLPLIQPYIHNESLFVKIKIEVLEDSSSSSQ